LGLRSSESRHPFGRRARWASGLSCGLSLGLAVLGSGCSLEDVDSDAIRTQGMYADILALAPGDGTTLVRVKLTVGGDGGTNITLVGNDSLQASIGELSQAALGRSGRGRYEQRINGDSAGEVTVRLLRGPDDAPASASAVLPEPFVMTLETDDDTGISRSDPVVVAWTPSVGGQIEWSVAGDCIWSASGITPDDGQMTLEPENIEIRGTRAGQDCAVQLTLDRSNAGTVDPVLVPSSKFQAVQRRGVSFVSTAAPGEVVEESAAPDAG
jgi:hypothetical protein